MMSSPANPRPRLRLCALVVLSVGLLLAPGAAQAAVPGTVVAWGCNSLDRGQCSVPSSVTGVTAIAAGFFHSLALESDGTVVAWGCVDANAGQCRVPSGLSGVTAISAGNVHSLALKSDGTVVAWGCVGIDYGQCSVPSGLSGVTAISAGNAHSLALKGDGTVVAWGCGGDRDHGQCSVPGGLSGVTAVAAGFFHSLALKGDGTVVAWGCGVGGDAGPCSVPSGLSGVIAIAAGIHSLALKSDGTVVAWGCGLNFGQCGVPSGLSDVTAVAASFFHSLALKGDGTVVAWGCQGGGADYGQCSVPSGLSGVTAISAGYAHSLAWQNPNQRVTFRTLTNKSYGDPDFTVRATASSGLAVSFAASGNCTVNGATVHPTGAGSCTITASQAGDGNYNAAPDVARTFPIAKAGQTITFDPLAGKTFGARDFSVAATASSGLPVSFAASGNCTVSRSTVHLTGAGSCTLTASQPGDANYNAATDVAQAFVIARMPCTVPKVVGKTLAAAKLAITQRHCRTGKVGHAYSGKKTGVVVTQSRRPGQVRPADSKLDLVVSRGRRR
jgi:hypothetical protein